MAYGDNYDYGESPLYKDDDDVNYYLDLSLTDTGHSGTELDPWSIADWQTHIFAMAAGSTIWVRGQGETALELNWTGYSAHHYRPWNPSVNGPWRLKLTGNVEHRFWAVYIEGGIIEITAGNPNPGSGTQIDCVFKFHYAKWDGTGIGCTFFAENEFEFSGFDFWDCAIKAPLMSGGGADLYNCALSYSSYTASGMSLTDTQIDWNANPPPLWDDPQYNYRNTYVHSDVDTPPQPGHTPYTLTTAQTGLGKDITYDTGLWGEPRLGIGAAWFNLADTIEPYGIPSEEAWGMPSIKRTTTVASGLPPAEPAREGDIKLFFATEDQFGEILPVDRDVERDPGFETAVLITLGTDKYADEGDPLPEDSGYRGGSWQDSVPTVPDYKMGTKLWLLHRAKTTKEIPAIAKEYLLDGFQWMIDDGIVESVEVSVERRRDLKTTLAFTLAFIKPEQTETIFYKFFYNWEAQILRRQ